MIKIYKIKTTAEWMEKPLPELYFESKEAAEDTIRLLLAALPKDAEIKWEGFVIEVYNKQDAFNELLKFCGDQN